MKQFVLFTLTLLVLPLLPAHAEEDPSFVRLPLAEYNRLSEAARDPKKEPRPAPSEFALGKAEIRLQVTEQDEKMKASVNVRLIIEILENEWVAVPILPPGTPVRSAIIAGKNAELFAAPDGLFWGVKAAGTYTMDLNYDLDAMRSEAGMSLSVPVPRAAAITLDATIPGEELSPAVIPSAGTNISLSGNITHISAAIPSTSGIQISWRSRDKKGHAISRASYSGMLEDEAVFWKGKLNVELFTNEPLTLPLLPQSATLSDVRLDGKSAPIMVDRGHFVTLVRGKGNHSLEMDFQVP